MFGRTNAPQKWAAFSYAALLCCCTAAFSASAQTPAPDNSTVNKSQHVTADQQSHHYSDREMTAKIRQSIVADHALSMYGHNVKIITENGAVTLKGPVHSDDEKQAIGAKAVAIAGQDKVTNDLTVKQ